MTTKTRAEPTLERLAYKPTEVAEILGISRGGVYDAVHSGSLPSVRIGRRIVVPAEALRQRLAGEDSRTDLES